MDYRASNLSFMSPPSVMHDELGLEVPPWEGMSVSQVLLPVLCALFIACVIVVIACCLIQKKAKLPGVVRQKSCHTIETLHEASDHDIYDVIEEIRAKGVPPDKHQRRQDKMDSSAMLRPRILPPTDLTNLFANKSSAISLHCASKFDFLTSKMSVRNSREWMLNNRGSVANNARISTNTDGGVSNTSNEDDGIYETLDRHWILKNEQLENMSIQTDVKKLLFQHQTGSCHDTAPSAHKNGNLPDSAKLNDDSCNCNDSNNGCLVLDISSAQTKESRRLLCQINMFEITNGEDNPTLIETSYYQVNPQISHIHENNIANISEVFQSSSLKIVSDSSKETNADVVLQALKDEEVILHSLPSPSICNNSQTDKQDKPIKTYEKLQRSNSKRFPFLAGKKSESFRAPSSELHTAKEQRRIHRRKSDSSDIDSQFACARSATRHANISAGPEATRILTKLGPLPPVPGQSHVSQQNASLKCAKDKLSCSAVVNTEVTGSDKCGIAVTSSSTPAGALLDIQNVSPYLDSNKSIQNVCQEKVDVLSSIQSTDESIFETNKRKGSNAENENASSNCRIIHDTLQTVSLSAEDHENINASSESGRNTDSDTASTGSACTESVDDSVCDNVEAVDQEDEGSNYYFVLESRDGTSSSSRNSDFNVTSDCESSGPTGNRDSSSSSCGVPGFAVDQMPAHLSEC